MAERSAGILLYRRVPEFEVLIGHMGGPYWAKKDAAAWSIPKGLYEPDEDPFMAAQREFYEEIGTRAPDDYDAYVKLGEFLRQSSGKVITVYVLDAPEFDPGEIVSNCFNLEWPPRSGNIQSFPEMDSADWFDLETARVKLVKGQLPMLDALERLLGFDTA